MHLIWRDLLLTMLMEILSAEKLSFCDDNMTR